MCVKHLTAEDLSSERHSCEPAMVSRTCDLPRLKPDEFLGGVGQIYFPFRVVVQDCLHILPMIWLTYFVHAITRFRATAP